MSTLSIISIVLFSLSGLLFVAFIVVFITTDVMTSVRYLKSKGNATENSNVNISSINVERRNITLNDPQSKRFGNPVQVGGIEYAQQTVDTDELDETNNNSQFETLDWDLPDGVSFVLTKNIVVCHTEKEYMQREG